MAHWSKAFLDRNGTARFALFQLEPIEGTSEKVNNIEINIIITHADWLNEERLKCGRAEA
jgi:hypothetical protein